MCAFFNLIEHPEANSEYPDQTPHYAVSDMDLHCLPMPNKIDARLIWFNCSWSWCNISTVMKAMFCLMVFDPKRNYTNNR